MIDNGTVILGLQEELRVLRHMHESGKAEIAKWRSAFNGIKEKDGLEITRLRSGLSLIANCSSSNSARLTAINILENK